MKDSLLNMNNAIDDMDIDQIEAYLDKMDDPVELEAVKIDSELFARRIIDEHKDKDVKRKMSTKRMIMFAACLVLAFAMGVTAHAAGLFNVFTYYGDSSTVEIRTDQELSQAERDVIVEEVVTSYENGEVTGTEVRTPEYKTYNGIEAVKEAIGVDIGLPGFIPEDFVMESEIMVSESFDGNHNIYVTYESSTDPNRMFGITVATQNYSEGSMVVSVTDTVYEDEYVSKSGDHFSIMSEDGGTVVIAELGHLQYALIFLGVEEAEIYQVIDSVDLGIYR